MLKSSEADQSADEASAASCELSADPNSALEQLLACVTLDNLQGEIDTGDAVEREAVLWSQEQDVALCGLHALTQ